MITKLNIKQKFIKLKNLLSNKERWIQRAFATDSFGNKVDPENIDSCKYCLVGGIFHLCKDDKHKSDNVNKMMSVFRDKTKINEIISWNDSIKRTHSDIMKILDKVIKSL